MEIRGTDVLLSLEGWKLVSTCGQCRLKTVREPIDLYGSVPRTTMLCDILPKLKCRQCRGDIETLVVECRWVLAKPFFASEAPHVDITHLLRRKEAPRKAA